MNHNWRIGFRLQKVIILAFNRECSRNRYMHENHFLFIRNQEKHFGVKFVSLSKIFAKIKKFFCGKKQLKSGKKKPTEETPFACSVIVTLVMYSRTIRHASCCKKKKGITTKCLPKDALFQLCNCNFVLCHYITKKQQQLFHFLKLVQTLIWRENSKKKLIVLNLI